MDGPVQTSAMQRDAAPSASPSSARVLEIRSCLMGSEIRSV